MFRRLVAALSAVALFSLTLAAAAEPPKSPYGMIRLLSLTCHQINDGLFGGDEEPILRVAGQEVWATEGARPGKNFDLSKIAPVVFHEKGVIALTERDPGNEDTIGTVAVAVQDIGAGKQSIKFEQAGSSYTLAYEVIRASGRCGRLQLHQLRCFKGVANKAGESDSISVSVDRFHIYYALNVGVGREGQTPLDKWRDLAPIPFSDAAAVGLQIRTEAPRPKQEKLDPKAMAANYRNTTLPAQQALVNLASKGKHRLTFRTAAGAHFEVLFEVLP